MRRYWSTKKMFHVSGLDIEVGRHIVKAFSLEGAAEKFRRLNLNWPVRKDGSYVYVAGEIREHATLNEAQEADMPQPEFMAAG